MYEKYKKLNDNAKKYLLKESEKLVDNEKMLKRCEKEIDVLYEKNSLFLIQYLYMYKKNNKRINYKFNGFENNLLLLYVLGISSVNPLKYNLPYEIFEESKDLTLYVEFINDTPDNFINECNTVFADDFIIIKARFKKEKDEALNELLSKHYLVILKSDYKKIDSISDYRDIEDEYLTIKLTSKDPFYNKKISITNALKSDFEKLTARIIEPKEFEDYVKIISMAHGVSVWDDNQFEMFIENQIGIKNIISSREDVYNYLLNHNIDKKTSLELMNFIRKGRGCTNNINFSHKWNDYKKIMKNHNCDDWFIEICSKIKYLSGKGFAIGECLYALDEKNYYSGKHKKNSCDIMNIIKE